MSDSGVRVVRVFGVAGALWGILLLVRGTRLWSALEDCTPSPEEEVAIRVLGARHLLQGLGEVAIPRRWQPLWVLVDLTHAASMIILAVRQRRGRRAALLSAGVALSGGLTTLVGRQLRRGGSGDPAVDA